MKRRLLKTVTAVVLSAGMVLCPIGGYIPDCRNVTVAYGDDLKYEGFKYKVVDGSYVEITGYTGSDTEVVIPGEIDGYKVEKIGDRGFSFYNCSRLKNITIPDSVTCIGDGVFDGCSGLTSIIIPDGVTSIGEDAFKGCSGLTSIIIPDGVTSIGKWTFAYCSGLTSIIIPDGVTSIGDYTFSDCSSLTSITIPDSVTSIGNGAFSGCSGLTSITIPNSVTSIGSYTFSDCSSLTSITIPDSVTSIGNGAFSRCENVIITCEENSYAHQYAKDNNIKYELTGSTGKKANSITCTKTYKKNMSTKAQSFTLNVKAIGGTITYKSNNSKVKVTGSGKVTIAKNFVGTAVITVTAGDSDYEKVTKKITIKILPTSTKITSAKNNAKGKITVKWGKVSNVTGYQLQYSTDKSFKTDTKTLLNKKASTTSKVITKLAKGNTYYLRIRTYKNVSGKNVYSAWSAKKKVKINK